MGVDAEFTAALVAASFALVTSIGSAIMTCFRLRQQREDVNRSITQLHNEN